MIEGDLYEFREWKFRYRQASVKSSRLFILLHGWTGDETSMWLFSHKLPSNVAILAPRGLYIASEGGFSWCKNRYGQWDMPGLSDFRLSAEALMNFVDEWSDSTGIATKKMDLIGFSQGAAFSYILAVLYPDRINALGILSGFLPDGAEKMVAKRILERKSVFIAHGRHDRMVPVKEARRSAALLKESGANVKYCESNDGHKVSVECFSEMAEFFL